MEKTKGGLYVPDGTISLKKKVWEYAITKLLKRFVLDLEKSDPGVKVFIICKACEQEDNQSECQTKVNEQGEIRLTCSCTERRLSNNRHE